MSSEDILFQAIENKKNVNFIRQLIEETNVKIDCVDKNSLTPLLHASFQGNNDLIKALLSYGADVNYAGHRDQYSALMFAALSGQVDSVICLLENQANIDCRNKVNRTASEMASFVGHKDIAAIINNYIDMPYIQGALNDNLISNISIIHELQQILNMACCHPIRLLLSVQQMNSILSNYDNVIKALDILSINENDPKTNEIKLFKIHFVKYFLIYFKNSSISKNQCGISEVKEFLSHILKNFLNQLHSKNGDYFFDSLLRQLVKEFPYKNSALFKSFLFQLYKIPMGSKPSTLEVLQNATNGPSNKTDDLDPNQCNVCHLEKELKICQNCYKVYYCSPLCQKFDWKYHKKNCIKKQP